MTVVFRLSGGAQSRVEAPFLVFKNNSCRSHVLVAPDNLSGVSYRTVDVSGWI